MKPGESVSKGWLCITSDMGEYKIPFEITAKKEQVQSFGSEIKDMPAFRELAQRDFREAYRLFTDSSFSVVMAGGRQETESTVCRTFTDSR